MKKKATTKVLGSTSTVTDTEVVETTGGIDTAMSLMERARDGWMVETATIVYRRIDLVTPEPLPVKKRRH